MSEKSDANVKAAIMQLKEEQILGWVQDQLERKAPPHEIMDELSAGLKKLGIHSSSELNAYSKEYKKYSTVKSIIDSPSEYPEFTEQNLSDNNNAIRRLARHIISIVSLAINFLPISKMIAVRLIKK